MASKFRDWAVTVYPLKYDGSEQNDIDDAEALWLHEAEHGPFSIDSKMSYLYGCMERGGKGSKLHCHYRAYYRNRVRLSTLQKFFGKNIKAKPVQDSEQYELYIRKEGKFSDKAKTHISGPWTQGERPAQGKPKKAWEDIRDLVKAGGSNAQILDLHPFAATQMRALSVLRETFSPLPPIPFETPFAYQKEVLDLCALPPTPRRWIWVYSKEFATGKSQLGVALSVTFPTLNASTRDPRSTLLMFRSEYHRVIVFDLPRLTHLTEDLLKLWEDLSDHKFLVSDKYESCQKFVKAHLVILTNRSPPLERFGDRIKAIQAVPIY